MKTFLQLNCISYNPRNSQLIKRQKKMQLYQHLVSTDNIIKRNTGMEQSMYSTGLARQFSCILIAGNAALIDPIATIAILVFIIGIDYRVNDVDLSVVRIDIYNKIEYNWDRLDRVTQTRHVCDIFNGIAFGIAIGIAIGILIEISSLSINFDETCPHLNTVSTIEFVYGNTSNGTIIISNFYKISGATIVVGVLIIDIYFVMQVTAGLSSNIIILYQFKRVQIFLYLLN